jgi:Uma2 family endonuclease
MTAAGLMTVEEYLTLATKPLSEYREGVLYPRTMPTALHGILELLLALRLRQLGLAAAPEVTVKISATRFLIPDVVAAKQLESPYPTTPVLLCCEVMSPEDSLGKLFAKCEEYHAWGVPDCWVIDPERRSAWMYPRGGEPLRTTELLEGAGVRISLPELFAEALAATH